jgi:hypothetical protein
MSSLSGSVFVEVDESLSTRKHREARNDVRRDTEIPWDTHFADSLPVWESISLVVQWPSQCCS